MLLWSTFSLDDGDARLLHVNVAGVLSGSCSSGRRYCCCSSGGSCGRSPTVAENLRMILDSDGDGSRCDEQDVYCCMPC